MPASDPPKARIVEASEVDAGQRIDNFLIKHLKGVPRTRIYKALRKGEVRVNGARKKPTYHVSSGDRIRIPPIRYSEAAGEVFIPSRLLDHVPVIYEDEVMMVLNKPAGLAVHGGSGMAFGLIEALRSLRPELGYIELVHRLDRETSGCLILGKSRPALVELQAQLSTSRSMRKHYVALVKGTSGWEEKTVNAPLKQVRDSDGMKAVVVRQDGQSANTLFKVRQRFTDATLASVEIKSGRMHQIRVHAAHIGHPIAGDRLYGDREFNRWMKQHGNSRLFLHAERLRLRHPETDIIQDFYAPLPESLKQILEKL